MRRPDVSALVHTAAQRHRGRCREAGHDDAALGRALAEAAGDVLLELRRHVGAGIPLARHGDAVAQDLLTTLLGELRPDDAVRSEEAAPIPGDGAGRLWIVDPLDGTREYAEPPHEEWAVHVALTVAGAPVEGAVAVPARGQLVATRPRPHVPPRAPGPLRVAVSRTRPPIAARALVDALGARLVPMGSAGVKTVAVLRGRVDAYVHAGGQYEWDTAAPVAVARAAGLHTSRLDGSPLVYGRPDPWSPDVLICRPELAAAIAITASRVA